MKVLVAYASRHGSTAGIASHIALQLRAAGLSVDVTPVERVRDVEPYDAVLVGGAAYLSHWLAPAIRFVRRHQVELLARPVWLFSSGPVGPDRIDPEGNDVLQTTRPKEFDELSDLVLARGDRVFFGAFDPTDAPVGIAERLIRHVPAFRESFPVGDFRDWDAIGEWAAEVAQSLAGHAAPSR